MVRTRDHAGLLKSESISKEPRNLKQIYNVKASAKKNKDELFEQIKYNDKYIKELCVGESIQEFQDLF
jgi:hypothetical protein